MSLPKWLALIVLATLPLMTSAQQKPRPSPADPNAPVPALGYVSIFGSYQRAADDDATPDAGWRAANEAVAGTGEQDGHAEHAMHGGEATPSSKANAPRAAQPTAAPTTSPRAAHSGHDGHNGHHSKGK